MDHLSRNAAKFSNPANFNTSTTGSHEQSKDSSFFIDMNDSELIRAAELADDSSFFINLDEAEPGTNDVLSSGFYGLADESVSATAPTS